VHRIHHFHDFRREHDAFFSADYEILLKIITWTVIVQHQVRILIFQTQELVLFN
jgi:hypothetical protein